LIGAKRFDVEAMIKTHTVGDKNRARVKNIALPTYAGVFMPQMIKNCQFFFLQILKL